MRLIAVMFVVACGRPPQFPVKPLPELISSAVPATPLAVAALTLPPGESLLWNVHWKGITIGRAELVVSDREVRSRFKTDMLVSTVVSVQHELETVLDRAAARASSATESLAIDGQTKQVVALFDGASYAIDGRFFSLPDGNPGHTLHSALGAVRAWAAPDAHPGFLFIVHAGQLVRLDVARPVVEALEGTQETKALRVECRVHPQASKTEPFAVTLWLTDDDKRTPIRIAVTNGSEHIAAELIDITAE
jgi:hypothetical protein